jgi:hypothetical protein
MNDELRKGIWSELSSGKTIDPYRRNLQKAYISRMEEVLKAETTNFVIGDMIIQSSAPTKDNRVWQSDVISQCRSQLRTLQKDIRAAIARTADPASKAHLEDCIDRINQILEPSK